MAFKLLLKFLRVARFRPDRVFGGPDSSALSFYNTAINRTIMTLSVEYDVIGTFGPVEIRKYPSLSLATVFAASDNVAFSILFDYISGNNEPNQRLAMTAPVISKRPTGEKIAMTAPVMSSEGSFSFVLPSEYDIRNAPLPKDPSIKIEQVPSRLVAVVKFSGRAHDREVSEEEKLLLDTLKVHNFHSKGVSFLMRYNGPFTPGFLRHNEIGIEVESQQTNLQ